MRFFLIAPEIGVGGAGFEGLQARAVLGSVKESSARERCAASVLHTGAANLQESCGVWGARAVPGDFAFRKVSRIRIAETPTHIQANQSPKRV